MAWKDVYNENDSFLKSYNGYYESVVTGKVCATLQYDDAAISPTSVKLRFKLVGVPEANYWDEYHVLLNPEDSSKRTLHLLKSDYTRYLDSNDAIAKWPYYASTTFTLTKAYDATTFTMPAFWLMNDGYNNTTTETATAFYNKYKSGGGRGPSLRTAYSSTSVAVASSATVATDGTDPTITVADRGNNTVLISGSLGRSGTNNDIKSANLYYTTDGSNPRTSSTRTVVSLTATSGNGYSETINISGDCTVKAYIVCNYKYNDTSATDSVAAKYYVKPRNSGKPKLANSSFRNNRLTAKQDWGWEWGLATAGNSNSPVKGYRVRFFIKRKGSSDFVNTKIIDYYDKTTVRSKELEAGKGDWVYDRTSTSYPMPMAAADYNPDIAPGDQIKLSVQAYSVNGADGKLLASEMTSDIYTIQNAGIVNVKANNIWHEGQVYVKVAGQWKEAETVNVKVDGSWKESQ